MRNNPHILFVDDDRTYTTLTKEYLEAKDFQVSLIHNAIDGLEVFKNRAIDICILDVKMPMKDGFSLAEDIRKIDDDVPIIFLTSETERESRIKGLTIGADDYITKPFSVEELYLRVKAILKRVGHRSVVKKSQTFQIGDFRFNPLSREISLRGEVVKLSAIESKLLTLFCENLNGLVSRELALNKVWGDEEYYKGRSLNVYVSKLRGYLKNDPRIEFLNVHGEGYRMVVRSD